MSRPTEATVRYGFLQYIRKILAVAHVEGGLVSVFTVGVYVYFAATETGLFGRFFDFISQRGLADVGMAIAGLGMWVGLQVGNALACFFVAYSLWESREWGRQLVLNYDGFVFLMSLAMLTLPLYAPTTPSPSFLLITACVLLISGSTILLYIRPSRAPV